MNGRAIGLVLIVAAALSGCSGSGSAQSAESSGAESLWSSRTAYVGDNSRVVALARQAGLASLGDYSVSLQTAHEPYGLTIAVEDPDDPVDRDDVSDAATLLLGLIGNLDEVSVTAGEQAFSFTADSVSDDLGYDVKNLGRDRSRLAAYLETLA
jgi:hypothetical protein